MSEAIGPCSFEERVVDGDTTWVALRARGAEWSWLTPAEAASLGRQWVRRYGHVLQDDDGKPQTADAVLLVGAE